MKFRQTIGAQSIFSKLLILVWASLFIGIPTIFICFLSYSVYQDVRPFFWSQVVCTVTESTVIESGTSEQSYTPQVAYSYSIRGVEYRGATIAPATFLTPNKPVSHFSSAQKSIAPYPVGSQTDCYVDLTAPERSVLRRAFPWYGFLILFPLTFVVIGVVVVWSVFKGPTKETPRTLPITHHLKPDRTKSRIAGSLAVLIFFALFFSAGVFGVYQFYWQPSTLASAAVLWQETSCTIEKSSVETIQGDDTTSYQPNILYRFNANGVSVRSSRYAIRPQSYSTSRAAREAAAVYAEGSTHQCWYDPSAPSESLLQREFVPSFVGIGVTALFAIVGAIGMLVAIKSALRGGAHHVQPTYGLSNTNCSVNQLPSRDSTSAMSTVSPSTSTGEIHYKSSSSRASTAVGLLIITTFWNGLLSFFVWHAYTSSSIGLTLFMIPFLLIGALLLYSAVHSLLSLCNPNVSLRVPALPCVGGRLCVTWELHGKTEKITELLIVLEAQEEVRFRRGTDTQTETRVFESIELARLSQSALLARTGRLTASIPANTMHSLSLPNNAVHWYLRVRGTVPNWPDIHDEFQIEVCAP